MKVTLTLVAPGTLSAQCSDTSGCAGDPDEVLAWCRRKLMPEAVETVRYLPHGAAADSDERVVPLRGHHGRHARLAVRGDKHD